MLRKFWLWILASGLMLASLSFLIAASRWHDEQRHTFLMWTSAWDYPKASRALIFFGADVNASDQNGWTPLMCAACCGQTRIVSILQRNGARVNEKNLKGCDALMAAARFGFSETATNLISQGANVNSENVYGTSPLMMAAWYGNIESVKILLRSGADVHHRNKAGQTALSLVYKEKNEPLFACLWNAETLVSTPK